MTDLTKTQREWLQRLAEGEWKVVDICSGGASQLITRLRNKGLIDTTKTEDWRDQEYFLTDAGRLALSSTGSGGAA